MFLAHALEKWRLQMMLARKTIASARASQCLSEKISFFVGKGDRNGSVCAERNVRQKGSREQS